MIGLKSSQNHRDRAEWWLPGARRRGKWRVWWIQSFSLGRLKKVLETDGGNGCISMWMYLVPPDYTLKNDWNGEF